MMPNAYKLQKALHHAYLADCMHDEHQSDVVKAVFAERILWKTQEDQWVSKRLLAPDCLTVNLMVGSKSKQKQEALQQIFTLGANLLVSECWPETIIRVTVGFSGEVPAGEYVIDAPAFPLKPRQQHTITELITLGDKLKISANLNQPLPAFVADMLKQVRFGERMVARVRAEEESKRIKDAEGIW